MGKEFVLMPVCWGDSKCFIIPKRQMELKVRSQYRISIEEIVEVDTHG